MFLKVSAGGDVTFEDRDNFRAFKLVAAGEPGKIDDGPRCCCRQGRVTRRADCLGI